MLKDFIAIVIINIFATIDHFHSVTVTYKIGIILHFLNFGYFLIQTHLDYPRPSKQLEVEPHIKKIKDNTSPNYK